MNGTVRSLNEYKYEKHATDTVDLRNDNTYRKTNQKQWTKKEYEKAYMRMLTAYVNN